MILSIEGEEKTGKTTLAYTAPLPIVGFSFDLSTKRALYGAKYEEYFKGLKVQIVKNGDKAEKGNDITVYELPAPIQLDPNVNVGYIRLRDRFREKLKETLEGPRVSLVLDTGTLYRKAECEAYLEFLQLQKPDLHRKQLQQMEYSHPDGSVRELYTGIANMEWNMVITHHLTDGYATVTNSKGDKESMATGQRVLEGIKQTYRFVDIGIRMVEKGRGLGARIETCGYSRELVGFVVEDPTWNKVVDRVQLELGGRMELDRRE